MTVYPSCGIIIAKRNEEVKESTKGDEPMANVCRICGKGTRFGNTITHRSNRVPRKWIPNLQRVRVVIDGSKVTTWVCTKCLKSGRVVKAI